MNATPTTRRKALGYILELAAITILAVAALRGTVIYAPYHLLINNDNVVGAGSELVLLASAPEEPLYLPWGISPDAQVEVTGPFVSYADPSQEPQPTRHIDCEVVVSESGGFVRYEVVCPLEATVEPPPTTAPPPSAVPPSPTSTPPPGEHPPAPWVVKPGDTGINAVSDNIIPGVYGSVGFLAYYTGQNVPVLITNAHVGTRIDRQSYTPTYQCCEGDEFYAPVPKAAGGAKKVIGELWYWYPHDIPNTQDEASKQIYWMDAAAIRLNDDNPNYMKNEVAGLTISGYGDPQMGEIIEKVGARTGLTYGQLYQEDICIQLLAASNKIITFCGQYLVKGKKTDDGVFHPFSLPGDSGSVAWRRSGGKAQLMCQIFAGTSDGKLTACTPAETIMRMMHLRLP